jgi:hypothetical protein
MGLRSTLKQLVTTETSRSKAQAMTIEIRQLPQYVICVGLGLLGGATGVALALGLAILIQLLLPPPTVFSPGAIPLMVMAILSGLGVSWLLDQVAHRTLSSPFRNLGEQRLQVVLVFSTATSLLQTLLLTQGL